MPRSFFVRFKQSGCVSRWFGASAVLALGFVLAACGGASGSANSALSSQGGASGGSNLSAGSASTPSGSSGQPTLPNGTPVNAYLIRALAVNLQVNKPLDVEHQITQDVLSMDPLAQPAGEQINQQSDGSYTVALTFAVSAAKYEAVKSYLGSFSATYPAFNSKLTGENETVQNVTTQYVDLQSRLKNLQTEQQRLLQLMSQAQNLADTLTIQDKLTDVEGQIEQIEGQINDLNGQTAYSMVTVNLASTAPAPAPTPPAAPPKPWNPGQIFAGAGSAMIAVLQVVADILIWVGVFAVFWVPVVVGLYLRRRVRQRPAKPSAPSVSTP